MKVFLALTGFTLLIITAVCVINMVTTRRSRSPHAIPSQSDCTAFRVKLVVSIFCGLVGAGLMFAALKIDLKESQQPATAASATEAGGLVICLVQEAMTEISVTPTAMPEETEMTPEELKEEFAHMTIHVDDLSADAEYGDYSPYILRSSFPAMNGWKSQTLSILGEPFVGAVSLPMIADQNYYDIASGYVRKTGSNSSEQIVATLTLRQQIEEWRKFFDSLDAEAAKSAGLDKIIEEMLRNPIFGDMVATGLAEYCPALVEVNEEWYPQLLEMFANAYDTSSNGVDDPRGVECFITYDTDDQELINSWSDKEKFAHMVRTEEYFYAITPLCDLLKEFEVVGYEERKSLHNYELKYNGLTSAARTREADEQEDRLALVLAATGKSRKVEYLTGFNFFDKRLEIFNIGTPVVRPTASPTVTPAVNRAKVSSPSPSVKPTDVPVKTSQPTSNPTPEPTSGKTPEPTPDPTPDPTVPPTPGPTPDPTVPPTPGPTPEPTVPPVPTPPKNIGDTSNDNGSNTDQSRGEDDDKGNGGSYSDSEEVSKGDIDNKVETDKANQETEQKKEDQMNQWKDETSTDPEGGTVVGGGDETPSVDVDHGPGSSGSGTESTGGNTSGGESGGNTGGNTSEDRNDTAVEEP